jgi:hypothetical protein
MIFKGGCVMRLISSIAKLGQVQTILDKAKQEHHYNVGSAPYVISRVGLKITETDAKCYEFPQHSSQVFQTIFSLIPFITFRDFT